MMRRALLCGALALIVPASSAAAQAPALPLATMQKMADQAIKTCRANGFRVSVVIVNTEGVARLMLRDDEATPHTSESAERKAYTAASFGMTTARMGEMATKNPDFGWLGKLDRVILVGGGLPIQIGGTLVGGIGVAGGIGPGTDETCAAAALATLSK